MARPLETWPGRWMMDTQALPVRLYQTADRIMLAAPMPGLEPSNISISIADGRVTIDGDERGPHQHERDRMLAEWAVGPYHRTVSLPQPINGALTNATYGNGVLILSMPKMQQDQHGVPATFRLEPVHATRGERVGHVGRAVLPMTTGEHQRDRHLARPARLESRASELPRVNPGQDRRRP